VAHFRRQIGTALLVNTAIAAVEAAASVKASSLSLLMDGIHNCSDELALVCLYLAFRLPGYLDRGSQRLANLLNSLGLVALAAVMIWQAAERLINPVPIRPLIPVLIGLAAAAANYGVARLLRVPARHNAAVRLAYLHNRGDVLVSLSPVAAGLLVGLSSRAEMDVLVTMVVALALVVTTACELRSATNDLLWPEQMTCCHTATDSVLSSP
jgi:cobalt-zinc-cadmium efflux system protein